MQVSLRQFENGQTNELSVSEQVFGQKYNEALIHQVVTNYLSNGRQGTKAQKTRSQVSGGGKKPWRQKGTGRARAGTSRSPIWRKGGVVFAAVPQDHTRKLNKKMYRLAICSMFSELQRKNRLHIFDEFKLDNPKTKELLSVLKKINMDNVLIITEEDDINLILAARNIPNVSVCSVREINPSLLISFENFVLTASALKKIEAQFEELVK